MSIESVNECPGYAALHQQVNDLSDRLDRAVERQDALEKLATSVEVLASKQEKTEDDISEMKTDIKAILNKSGKRWDSVVDKIILAVVGALVAALLLKLGLPM